MFGNRGEKRFEVMLSEGQVTIFRDKETDVQYVFVKNGQSAGLTQLLDKDGKPLLANNTK